MLSVKFLSKTLVPALTLGTLALGAAVNAQTLNFSSTLTLTNPTANGITVDVSGVTTATGVNATGLGTSAVIGGFRINPATTVISPATATYTSAFTDALTITDVFSTQQQTINITGNLTVTANSSQVVPFTTFITLNPATYTATFPTNRYFIALNNFDDVANANANRFGTVSYRFSTTAVPEPGSVAMLIGMGASGAGFLVRRRKSVKKAA